jgi:hypothetical protein
MQGQNIRHKVQIVISGAFNNKSVHFVGVIIVCIHNIQNRADKSRKTYVIQLGAQSLIRRKKERKKQ